MLKTSFLKKIVIPSDDKNPFEISYLIYLVHQVWTPFNKVFKNKMSLHDSKSRATFLYWWLGYGLKNYPLKEDLVGERNWDNLRKKRGITVGELNWDWLAEGAFNFDGYPGSTQVPTPTEPNTEEALKWVYVMVYGKQDMAKFLKKHEIHFLLSNHEKYSQQSSPLTRLQVYLYELSPDLQKKFSLDSTEGRDEFKVWYQSEGRDGYRLNAFENLSQERVDVAVRKLGFGVNVIGHQNSTSGVGEDVRMAQASFSSAGIKNQCVPYLGYGKLESVQGVFSVNLLCLTGFQALLSLAALGDAVFENYTIGYYPWELEEWPDDLDAALELCDEHWTSSRFIYDSIKAKTTKPVFLMPMAVDIPESTSPSTSSRVIDSSKVKYLFMFDLISGVERKNARACLSAFKKAFANNESAQLTIKLINPQGAPDFFKDIENELRDDSRITLIADTLERQVLIRLIAEHDVFISLHRSEGFGRGIAESLLLGKQVVVTNYSGNKDFCLPAFSFLVDFDLIPVKADEYVFSQNQVWADPKLESAIEQLKRCHAHVLGGGRFNAEGQRFIQHHYSIAVVGKKYHDRLKQVGVLKA